MADEQVFTFRFEEGKVTGSGGGGGGGGKQAEDAAARAAEGIEQDPEVEELSGGAEEIGALARGVGGVARTAIVGTAVAAAAAFAAGAIAVKALVSAIDDTTQKLEEFSPALSAEQAQSEALQTIQRVRQAQEIGPTLAEFQSERAELGRTLSDIKIGILKFLVPIATDTLAAVNKTAKITEDETKRENRPALLLSELPFLTEENPALLRDLAITELDPQQFGFLNLPPGLGLGP